MRHILVLLALVACGSGSSRTAPTAGPPTTAAVVAREEACYAGTAKVVVDGHVVAEMPTIARRIVDPASSTITEEVTQVSDRGVESFTVDMKITGSSGEMKEAAGAFTGTVTLVGEPWRWQAWSSVSNLPNGMVVKSTDTLEADSLRATKEVYQGDQRVVTMDDVLARFDCAELAAKRSALTPP